MRWLLLIYTVPAEPSRKRAFVWREIKRVGAVYLHDGVCVLPQSEFSSAAFAGIAQRIMEFQGRATVVAEARLDPAREEEVRTQMQAVRAAEYAAVRQDAEAFLDHIRRETAHRDFSLAELGELAKDLEKLRRWYGQVRGRDYVTGRDQASIDKLLHQCAEALLRFLPGAVQEAATG